MGDLAFSTLVVYSLLLPGMLFQKGYAEGGLWFVKLFRLDRPFRWLTGRGVEAGRLSGDHPTHPRSARSFPEELLKSFLAAVVLHAIWVPVFWFVFGKTGNAAPDFSLMLLFAFGFIPKDKTHLEMLKEFGAPALWYIGTLWLASWNLGRISLSFVRSARLDHRTRMFRFKDPWFYRLRGEILCFKEFSSNPVTPHQIVSVNAKIVVRSEMGSMVYTGTIVDYTCTSSFDLKELVLSEADCHIIDRELREVKTVRLNAEDLVILNAERIESLILSPMSIPRQLAEEIIRADADLIEEDSPEIPPADSPEQ